MTPTPLYVLLVEDNPAHADAICRALEDMHPRPEIRVVSSLREYRAAAATAVPGLVLMDLNLPDGRAETVLQGPAGTGACPILVMTSHGDEETAVAAMKAGALDYLVKSPESLAVLPQTLVRARREWDLLVARQQAVAALQASERKYRELVENSSEAIYVLQDGRFCFVNRRSCELTGVAAAAMLGRSMFEFLPESEHEHARRHHAQVVQGLWSGGADDFQMVSCAGERRWIRVTSANIEWEGRPATLNFAYDITSSREQQALAELVAQQAWTATRDSFFPALAMHLTQTLGVAIVAVARLRDAGTVETVALCADGKMVPNISYGLAGAPCGNVVGREPCHYPRGVRQLFPADALLVEVGAESYLGYPLWDSVGKPIGLIAILDRKPMPDPGRALSLLRMAGVRAAGALERARTEAALRESEARLRLALDAAKAGTWEWNLQTNENIWADSCWDLYGLTRGAGQVPSYDTWRQCVSPDDLPGIEQAVSAAVRQGTELNIEWRVRQSAGNHDRWVMSRGCPVRDAAGQVVRYRGVVIDISERRRVEQEREALIAILRLINGMDNTPELIRACTEFLQQWSGCEAVGVRLKDGDDYPYFETRGFAPEFVAAERCLCQRDPDGRVVCDGIGNPVLECMCGNILQGRFDPAKPFFTAHGSFWSNCTSDLLARTTEADRQARTRNRCNGEGYESVALIPLRYGTATLGLLQLNDRRRNRFSLAFIHTVERLADGLATGLAQRQAQAAVQASEAKYRIVADNTGDWEFWCGVDGSLRYCSPSCLALTGYSAAEFLAQPDLVAAIVHPDDRERYSQHVREADVASAPGACEFRIACKDGQCRWLEHVCQPVYAADGAFLGTRGSNRDVTARRQAQERIRELNTRLEAKNQALQRLVYLTSHQLRTPLVSIQGFLARLNNELVALTYAVDAAEVPEARREAVSSLSAERIPQSLHFISKAVVDMGRMVNGLRALARAGSLELQIERVDMDALMAGLVADLAEATAAAGAVVDVAPLPPCHADAMQLQTVFACLLDNALKYRDPKRPLHVHVSGLAEPARTVYVVADNGQGINREELTRIWDVFQRLRPEAAAGGDGIGLTLVRTLVERHGGDTWAESTPGVGTRVCVALPVARPAPPERFPL